MKVSVCIGSSCHLKGSRYVVKELQELLEKNGLTDKVNLCGTFCLGKCQQGVCVCIDDDQVYSVSPETAAEFFETQIKPRIA